MRYDLIPKLVECVKGVIAHERQLTEELSKLRSQAKKSRENKLKLEGKVATSVDRTIARVESYPDLKAQGTSFQLTRQLRAIEEKIAHGRTIHNESVCEYNDLIRMFPQVVIAILFNFAEHTFFSTPEEKTQLPDVDMSGMEFTDLPCWSWQPTRIEPEAKALNYAHNVYKDESTDSPSFVGYQRVV